MFAAADEECSDGEMRLVPDSQLIRPVGPRGPREIEPVREGRLEICYQGVWGAVYDANWTAIDAAVTCQEFGFDPRGTHVHAWLCDTMNEI